jgi:hypothetical protein
MAQAAMLDMENKDQADLLERAEQLSKKALNMAMERATNDNMIRYVRFCL